MYAKYVYTAGATDDQVLDDVFEIFVGETVVGNLSAGCDTANSQILTTYSTSPWTDFDDVSVNHDGVDELAFTIMESWDAGTDTPTNEVPVNYDKQGMGFEPGVGGTMHLYASTFCLIMMHQRTGGGMIGQFRGDPTYGSVGIFECSRDHPSLALGDMPNWFLSSTAMFADTDTTMKATFWKGRDETDTVLTPFTAEMCQQARDVTYNGSNKYPAAIGSVTALTGIGAPTRFILEPIVITGSVSQTLYDATTFYGDVSSRCDIWYLPEGTNEVLDLIHVDGLPYIIFKAGTQNISTAGTSVGVKFVVPYG